ncbi:MAG: CoA transferase [Gammaproteobacteria bacterium]|nr:CoA transferase [Gammaproteobacteria bacterium]
MRVLDFGRYIAGPFCGALLGDLGADVIRIEKVDGSEDRFTVPVNEEGVGAGFLQLNRNKRGITLNPRKPEGQDLLKRLVSTADVVLANLPPDTVASMGLDYDTLCAIKADIILATSTAFGSKGPYGTRVGFDGVAQAMSGNLHMTGHADEPMKNCYPYVDYCTGALNTVAILAAIVHRMQTGEGQHVEGALLASAVTIAGGQLVEQALTKANRKATGNRGQTSGPSDVFKTRDGWIIVQVVGNPLFERWAKLMGEDHWLEDARFASDEARGIHGELITERMSAWTQTRTTKEAMAELEIARVPCGEVLTPAGTLENEQVKAMGLIEDCTYPGIGSYPLTRMPFDMSRMTQTVRRRPPTLGEHTDEVLTELGYTEAEVALLKEHRVV